MEIFLLLNIFMDISGLLVRNVCKPMQRMGMPPILNKYMIFTVLQYYWASIVVTEAQ